MLLFGVAILLICLQQGTLAYVGNETKVDNATRITVTTISNLFDAKNNLKQAQNITKTVGTIDEALALMSSGLKGNDGGKSIIMLDNSTQVVDNSVAREVLEKSIKDWIGKPGAPGAPVIAGAGEHTVVTWWGCETFHQPIRCVHVTIGTSLKQ